MTGSLFSLYGTSLGLLTDLYQLTMAQGYFSENLTDKEAVFHLFFRRMPFQGGFAITAGLQHVIEWIENFKVSSDDVRYLSTLKGAEGSPLFTEAFLDYFSQLRFTGNIEALPEGSVAFSHHPLIRVQAPLIQAQLLETPLLNLVNFASLIATKAARVCLAAQGEPILEFGIRRAQGVDGAMTASRSAYIGGCSATSNVLAGKIYGIPVKGTHAHSWVMAFETELEAFEAYARAMPENALFLVDTYASLKGVENAILVAKKMRDMGKRFLGIRLDSGDLAYLSIQSRAMLDAAGFPDAVIVASNELDEILISELKRQGAKINVWGVGTNLVTAGNQPALDGVYKLSALRDPGGEWEDKIKLSEQLVKVTTPGILQSRRYKKNGENVADALYDIRQEPRSGGMIIDPFDPTRQIIIDPSWTYEDLLKPIFKEGKNVYKQPSLEEIRRETSRNLSQFNLGIKRFYNPHVYTRGLESSLYFKKLDLIKRIRQEISAGV